MGNIKSIDHGKSAKIRVKWRGGLSRPYTCHSIIVVSSGRNTSTCTKSLQWYMAKQALYNFFFSKKTPKNYTPTYPNTFYRVTSWTSLSTWVTFATSVSHDEAWNCQTAPSLVWRRTNYIEKSSKGVQVKVWSWEIDWPLEGIYSLDPRRSQILRLTPHLQQSWKEIVRGHRPVHIWLSTCNSLVKLGNSAPCLGRVRGMLFDTKETGDSSNDRTVIFCIFERKTHWKCP